MSTDDAEEMRLALLSKAIDEVMVAPITDEERRADLALTARQRLDLAGAAAVLRIVREVTMVEAHVALDLSATTAERWADGVAALEEMHTASDVLDAAIQAIRDRSLPPYRLRTRAVSVWALQHAKRLRTAPGRFVLANLIRFAAEALLPAEECQARTWSEACVRLHVLAAAAGARLDGGVAVAVALGGLGVCS